MTDDRPHLSFSALTMLLRCEYAWWRRYVLGERSRPKAAASVGTACHEGAAAALVHKRDNEGAGLSAKEAADIAVAKLESVQNETVWDEPFVSAKDEIPGLMKVYVKDIAPQIDPLHIEQPVEYSFGDRLFTLKGRLDCVERWGTVRDTKTSGKTWGQGRIEESGVQGTIYTLDDLENPSLFTYDIIVRLKKPRYQQIDKVITVAQKRAMLQLIDYAWIRAQQIRSQEVTPLPTGHATILCSHRWCGYAEPCFGKWGMTIKQ